MTAAIEESDAVASSQQKDSDSLDDLATAAQDAADEYIQDAADSFFDEEDEK